MAAIAPAEEWVGIERLARETGFCTATLRKYAKKRLITFRRRGIGGSTGRNLPLEFPLQRVKEQIGKLRETGGVAVPNEGAADPRPFMLLQKMEEIAQRLDRIEAAVGARRAV